MGATKAKWRGGQLAYYDGITYETVKPLAPTVLYDDFLGTTLNTDIWTGLDVATGTLTAPAASIVAAELAANNVNEAAGLYGKDDLAWNIDKGLIFECRLAQTVAVAGTTEVHIGVIGDAYGADSMLVAAADEIDKHALFVFDGGAVCTIYTDDTGVDHNAVATGITVSVAATAYHIFRIDFTDSAAVKFYIDGAQVAVSTTFKLNTVAALMVQPWVVIYKHDNANGLGKIAIDYIRMWQATR